MSAHFPVLLEESLKYLAIRPDGFYCDATAGLGNHTAAIAARLESGLVIANDRDADSLELARANAAAFVQRIRYHHGPFSRLGEAIKEAGVDKLDGLLVDLGVSRMQLTEPERGFSFMADGPLDMRMDRSQPTSAYEIVNFSSEKELAELLFTLGEERRSRRIARAIVRARPIHTTGQLARAVEDAVPRTSRLHPATQTFMALRIGVNEELVELDSLLRQAPKWMKPGGRVVIISFMSLEDRRVKLAFQALSQQGRAVRITRHVVTPTEREIEANPPSRSAKLRAVEIIGD